MLLPFSKFHVNGNDFIVLNHIYHPHPITPALVQALADRRKGIGADQVLIIEAPQYPDNDFLFRVYNADGSKAEFCGNGAACFAYYAHASKLTHRKILHLETVRGCIRVNVPSQSEGAFKVCIPPPLFDPQSLPTTLTPNAYGLTHILIDQQRYSVRLLSLGNPHCILQSKRIENIPLHRLAQRLQNHPAFPQGINVSVMQVRDKTHIDMRVYERGAGETLCCGSAACAGAISAILANQTDTTVEVSMPGGSVHVHWPQPSAPVVLSCYPTYVAQGHCALSLNGA
jgi:diaminopimelate epimerase